MARVLRNLMTPPWAARVRFNASVLDAIEAAIRESETRHGGEIVFAVESALDVPHLWRGGTARERALEVFSELGAWDTERNSGVLIFVLLAEHDVEIVADRGAAANVAREEWDRVCNEMETLFRAGRFQEGALAGVRGVGELLARNFPPRERDPNELRDRPVVR
jgi:uncharacterized membrane protein